MKKIITKQDYVAWFLILCTLCLYGCRDTKQTKVEVSQVQPDTSESIIENTKNEKERRHNEEYYRKLTSRFDTLGLHYKTITSDKLSQYYFESPSWQKMEEKSIKNYTVTKTEVFLIDKFTFNIIWDDKLTVESKPYKGIKKMDIYIGRKRIQTLYNIKDEITLGEIYLRFYDYNADGNIDFSIPINERYCMYYLFNPKQNKFEHNKDWDYMRLFYINPTKKQFLTIPDGNALTGDQNLYQITENNQLKKLKKIYFHTKVEKGDVTIVNIEF